MSIVHIDFKNKDVINADLLTVNNASVMGYISPAMEDYETELAEDRSADPIKSMADIERISEYLIRNKRYRDNMLFIVGINFGLRVSDLRKLRFADLINNNFIFKNTIPVFERKTRNTRKRKKNRYITINQAVIEAVTLYLKKTPGVCLSDYMFRGESNRNGMSNDPLTIQSINRILYGIKDDLCIDAKISSHSLRKTFCYHQMLMSHNDPRKLLLLQKMLGHSSSAQTLDYIGITAEEMDEAYRNLNLGSIKHNYLINCDIVEDECVDKDKVPLYG